MPNVLLLREPSTSGAEPDKYESAFASAGYAPLSVPVLETVLVHVPELRDLIAGGPTSKEGQTLRGVIVTSKRSCEAWRDALGLLFGETQGVDRAGVETWSSIPFYVVGHTTSTALQAIFAEFGLPPPDVRGQDSGSAAALAPFILHDLGLNPDPDQHPHQDLEEQQQQHKEHATLLYLTGDKNRDTLPKLLREHGVALEELQVYKTQGSARFEEDLRAALGSPPSSSPSSSGIGITTTPWWIVYFAPSAAAFVTPILEKYFVLPYRSSNSTPPLSLSPTAASPPPTNTPNVEALPQTNFTAPAKPKPLAKIASIGPTTTTFLLSELKLEVHVTAPKPTPEGIVDVIRDFDARGLLDE